MYWEASFQAQIIHEIVKSASCDLVLVTETVKTMNSQEILLLTKKSA